MEPHARRSDRYRRVSGRIMRESRPSAEETRSFVTKHVDSSIPSRTSIRELPLVLGPPESPPQSPSKPRKTLRSRSNVGVARDVVSTRNRVNVSSIGRVGTSMDRRVGVRVESERATAPVVGRGRSAPCVVTEESKWADLHMTQCYSSRSHAKLNDIKEEIKEYRESTRLEEFRSRLLQRCGVLLNEDGIVEEQPRCDTVNILSALCARVTPMLPPPPPHRSEAVAEAVAPLCDLCVPLHVTGPAFSERSAARRAVSVDILRNAFRKRLV